MSYSTNSVRRFHMPMVTTSVARQLESLGRPWHVRLENQSSRNAFWEAWGSGNGMSKINWGKLGTSGRTTPQVKVTWETLEKADDKTCKDYTYPSQTIHRLVDVPEEVKKLTGPFAKIHKIKVDGDVCIAYDAAGNRLMRMPKATANQLHAESGQAFILELVKHYG